MGVKTSFMLYTLVLQGLFKCMSPLCQLCVLWGVWMTHNCGGSSINNLSLVNMLNTVSSSDLSTNFSRKLIVHCTHSYL